MINKTILIASITGMSFLITACNSTGGSTHNLKDRHGKSKKGGRMVSGGPPSRSHTETSVSEVILIQANSSLSQSNLMQVTIDQNTRVIVSNGIPEHKVGAFPNKNNPNRIQARDYRFKMTTKPRQSGKITSSARWYWGVAMNGVPFEAQTAEYWQGKRGGWNYDALGGALPLGLDENNAHVQPTGAYHYHGLPVGLLQNLGWKATEHSPQIGWAADGYPVYALTGNLGDGVKMLTSSYRLKEGQRPGGSNNPDGSYDGTFNQDWQYVKGAGDLDECNGAITYSDEFPKGSYGYFLTKDHPFLSRCWTGTPNRSFFTNH